MKTIALLLVLATASAADAPGPPETPSLVDTAALGREAGRSGGMIEMLIAGPKDLKLLGVYGYARLVGYNETFELAPDILEAIEVEEGRRFTLRLRRGHKWSDGAPFTSEDFRYYWEDVANNPALSPAGPPRALTVFGASPKVEIVDERTIRYSWPRPNPLFLNALAAAQPLEIYRPAHYLKRYHARYADPALLDELAKARGLPGWAALHNRLDDLGRGGNVDLPRLDPWINVTAPPAQRFIARRNPYFHRVDGAGRQLPYIDALALTVSSPSLIAARAGAGEADLQARGLSFADAAFLKQAEKKGGFRTLLWPGGKGAHLALYPNLNANDAAWRALFRDRRFRQALSLSIDRGLINQALYFGLALEAANAVLPESPLYELALGQAFARYDPAEANRLLDDIGLGRRNADGVRLLPDGREAAIIVETAGESSEQIDALEFVGEGFRAAGLQLYVKSSQREILRNRVYSGAALMSVWSGLENGAPTPAMSPAELAPTVQDSFLWPQWGLHYETSGQRGSPPDLAAARTLLDLFGHWLDAADDGARRVAWRRMLALHAEEAFSIGVVAGVPQPVVVSRRLRNVPESALYLWDPGGEFGVHRPDLFFFAEETR